MAKKVYVFLAEGFEEIEAVATVDLLRRAGLSTVMVSIGSSLEVVGAHHIPLRADKALQDIDPADADAYVLPGGLPGVTNLNECADLRQIILRAEENGKLVAAICAAPMILGQLGLLNGKLATCYPSFEQHLRGYRPTEERVVVDGRIITASGVGVAMEFALEIITYLLDASTADQVANAILLK